MAVKGVLITGVSGFLGQGLVNALHDNPGIRLFGHSRKTVDCQVRYEGYNIRIVKECTETVLNDLRIDTIIHLAGIAHDLSNQYKEEDYYRVNDQGTRALYDRFLHSKAKRFIFLSSIKAAVDNSSLPIDELVSPAPSSPYGMSKVQAEKYIGQQQLLNGDKKYYILRPCMIHGPGNKGNLNLLYRYVKSGLPFPFGAFHNKRSFLSVANLNFVVLRLIEGDILSGIYHLADDGYFSPTELFELIVEVSGKRSAVLNISPGLIRAGFRTIGKSRMLEKLTEDMLVSNQKIKRALNCELPVTMRDGLIRTIRSFESEIGRK